jgi:hypothetical protein
MSAVASPAIPAVRQFAVSQTAEFTQFDGTTNAISAWSQSNYCSELEILGMVDLHYGPGLFQPVDRELEQPGVDGDTEVEMILRVASRSIASAALTAAGERTSPRSRAPFGNPPKSSTNGGADSTFSGVILEHWFWIATSPGRQRSIHDD